MGRFLPGRTTGQAMSKQRTMSLSVHDALRRQLALCFDSLTQDIEDAGKVDQVVMSLKATFYDSMRDIIRAWSTRSALFRFPAEVLAMCIGLLPLRSRIVATHVSHAWRAAALAVPAVWATIDITPQKMRAPDQLVELVLSRSGNRPIDFTVPPYYDSDDALHCAVLTKLNAHMDRVRSVYWGGALPSYSFDCPAPMLESFDGILRDGLGKRFLGGCPGVLRTLRLGRCFYLPNTCPAVATVTELDIELTERHRAPSSQLSRLFDFFPRLRSLSVSYISDWYLTQLLEIRPHCPLSKLGLKTRDRDCDVFALYEAWQTSHLEDIGFGIELEDITTPEFAKYLDLSCVLDLRVTIPVDKFGLPTGARFEALGAHGDNMECSLDLRTGSSHTSDVGMTKIARHFAGTQDSLTQLHSLTVPTALFAALCSHDVIFPALKHLTLICMEKLISQLPQSMMLLSIWPWEELEQCVQRLLFRPVDSLVVLLKPYFSGIGVDEVDVLLRELRPIAPGYQSKYPVGADSHVPAMQVQIRGVEDIGVELESAFLELGICCDPEGLAYLSNM